MAALTSLPSKLFGRSLVLDEADPGEGLEDLAATGLEALDPAPAFGCGCCAGTRRVSAFSFPSFKSGFLKLKGVG